MLYKLRVNLVKIISYTLKVDVILTATREDKQRILEAAEFQPNDVY